MRPRPIPGFTLIEVMIVVAIVAILATLTLPAYGDYVRRAKVPAGLEALAAYSLRMEQYYQDHGSYAGTGTACGVPLPSGIAHFSIACSASSATAYTATATGHGTLEGYAYTVDHTGTRKTSAHPKGRPTGNCWSVRGGACDS